MNTNQNNSSPYLNPISYWIVAISILAGLILSIVSWMDACTEACSAAHQYRFFGLRFEWLGVTIFLTAGLLHFYAKTKPYLTRLVGLMMIGALGSEVVFIGIQKYVIGSWCPLCLSIASTIGIIVLVYVVNYIKNLYQYMHQKQKGLIMKQLFKSLISMSVFTLGFLIASAGVAKPSDASAAVESIKDQLQMGNTRSNIKVYFISDWFCGACKKTEPEITKIYPAIKDRVGFYFVDLAVHSNTINYTPYNIAFIVNDKAQYMEIRHELDELSYREDSPTDEQMESIAKKLNASFHEVSFREIKAAMKYFDEISTKYNVTKTPTMVIENTKTGKNQILNGTGEITLSNVNKTIEELSK